MPLWNSPDNPFLCIVIPASTESEILMHAVIGLSAYHHSVQEESAFCQGQSEAPNTIKALHHRQRVLNLLQENLTKPDLLRDDATLAACMLMQTLEVCLTHTAT